MGWSIRKRCRARPAGPSISRRYRRRARRPLRDPRFAESQLRRVGAGLWAGRFAKGAERARQGRQSHGGTGAERAGRYVIPDLPKANYGVWVRGYGLVDSQKVQSAPGRAVNLTAVPAPSAAAAAALYPPVYWFSMLRVPDKREFPLEK